MKKLITDSELDNVCIDIIDSIKVYDVLYSEVCVLLYVSGCRCNDVLERNRWKLLLDNRLELTPQKNNNKRYFNQEEVTEYWYSSFLLDVDCFFDIDYRKFNYYLEMSLNKYYLMTFSKRISTHIFRHNFARKLKLQGLTDNQIKDRLGEKQLSSAQKYIYSQIFWHN